MRDEIFLVRKLSRFAQHMCSCSDNDIYGSIRAILNKEQFKNFCENNIFGYFMQKKQCVVQAQLCRCVMTLEVKGSSSSGIMICANDTSLSFTPMKFAIITGLNCVSNRYDFIFYEGVPNRMIEKYFNGAESIQKRQLFLVFTEKVWGEDNDEDAEKVAILYFLHSSVLSNIDTVVIPRLYFDLVDSDRYKDFPWGSLSFEDLARSLNKRLKVGGKFYLIQEMPLTIQVWLYECCSNVPPKIALKVENQISRLLNWKMIAPRLRYEFLMNAMFKDNGKVVFKNIESTEMELAKLEIPQKDVTEDERSVDSDDDFQDPLPKKINGCSKKKQKMDSSTPIAKKPSGKKQVNIVDVHIQTRTPPHRAAKAAVMKTPVFKPVLTRQVQSKGDSHVKEVAVSKREIHIENEIFITKKVFDAFREEVRQEFIGVREEFTRIRQLVKKKFKKMVKAIEHSKQQYEDTEVEAQQMDYAGVETLPQEFSPIVDQNLNDNQNDKTNIEIDSQHLIPDELLQSINLNYNLSEKIVHHDDQIIDEKLDDTNLSDSQFTIPDELLPSLNAYRRESITRHPLITSEEEQIDKHFNDKMSESLFRIIKNKENVGSCSKEDMHGEVDLGTEEQIMRTPKIQELTTDEQRDEIILPDSQDTIPDDLLPSLNVYSSKSIIVHPSANRELQTPIPKLRIRRPSKFKKSPYTMKFGSVAESSEGHIRIFPQKHSFVYHLIDGIVDTKIVNKSVHDVYSANAENLTVGGHVAHLNEYINGFRMHAAVPWHTVEDIYIPKLAAIIPLYLEYCDFYVKKGIHVEHHPKYKDKDSSDMFDVLFQERIVVRTRYAALLWDYGTRKQDVNVHSDVEAPLRPPRQSRIASMIEVFDV
ncbi:uncharacterized protein LOC124899634 [Capsicum annuum]|uniref:uncharacterized protein LOC124899634 n=1 Tax=Capsicum annuum TaxID=4072 RepID=UPI001FB0B830|nr:uncharacterized protein LOC124899634 [Capsicum annuum]